MIKLFYAPRARSLRVRWMAEEMGLPIEISAVDLRGPRPPEFLAVNPASTLPAIVDGEVVMTESVAIIQYMADRYGPTDLSVKPDEAAYPDYLQFLFLGEAGLGAPVNAMIGAKFFAPEDQKDNWCVGMVREGFVRRTRLLDRQLERHDYLAADRFTAADISVVYALGLAFLLEFGGELPERVQAYYHRQTERPAYQRAIGPV